MTVAVRLARRALELLPTWPEDPTVAIGCRSEIFRHSSFVAGDAPTRERMMLASAQAVYDDERTTPWDGYFGRDLSPLLAGKDVLDLGCFTGGRAVAWAERYGVRSLAGIDVRQVFVDAASLFARQHGVPATFTLGRGESIPFPSSSFDVVVSFEVLEHVQDPARVLAECRRVLRAGGRALIVFPSFFHPLEHHLSLASRTPFVHYFFGRRTLLAAYSQIIAARAETASWYARTSCEPHPWERGNTINGLTVRRFRRLARGAGLVIEEQLRPALGTVGRKAQSSWKVRAVGTLLTPFAHVPLLEEAALHRAVFVLRRD
jgi:SAM-dependent methyltransferase